MIAAAFIAGIVAGLFLGVGGVFLVYRDVILRRW